ncbi:hypothetical protein GQ53DRAFT_764963 [Thozetella sp. PMI_491]|nr:hypothetical protein GQ53DRAFT_764963 [Thozetella sp. PMI_491]
MPIIPRPATTAALTSLDPERRWGRAGSPSATERVASVQDEIPWTEINQNRELRILEPTANTKGGPRPVPGAASVVGLASPQMLHSVQYWSTSYLWDTCKFHTTGIDLSIATLWSLHNPALACHGSHRISGHLIYWRKPFSSLNAVETGPSKETRMRERLSVAGSGGLTLGRHQSSSAAWCIVAMSGPQAETVPDTRQSQQLQQSQRSRPEGVALAQAACAAKFPPPARGYGAGTGHFAVLKSQQKPPQLALGAFGAACAASSGVDRLMASEKATPAAWNARGQSGASTA